MKPTNVIDVPSDFWALRDERGLLYAYSTPKDGVRCTESMPLARKYSTERGALVAMHKIRKAYGKQTRPIHYTTQLTYHETSPVPS